VRLLREHDRLLGEVAQALRTRPDDAPELVRVRERERRELEKALKSGGVAAGGDTDLDELLAGVVEVDGAAVLASVAEVPDAKALLALADRLKGKLSAAAIVLGAAVDGRVHLLVSVAPELVERGVNAGAVVKAAAEVVGGGGGGRDTLAQAGGRDPDKLDQALEVARAAIAAALQR
jgi:alanyl-tRNA synthetase